MNSLSFAFFGLLVVTTLACNETCAEKGTFLDKSLCECKGKKI